MQIEKFDEHARGAVSVGASAPGGEGVGVWACE